MINIKTDDGTESLREVAEEDALPRAKRAKEAILAGNTEEALRILNELTAQLYDDYSFLLWENLRELIFHVLLWKHLPESEKEGTSLTAIRRHREEVLLLLLKAPELYAEFREELLSAFEAALPSVEIFVKNTEILMPSDEELFEKYFQWEKWI
jgi:hypothetical protein